MVVRQLAINLMDINVSVDGFVFGGSRPINGIKMTGEIDVVLIKRQ